MKLLREDNLLDRDRVLALFSLFSDLEGDGLGQWRSFCDSAAYRVEKRLRPDADAARDGEALCAAAAAWAYCDYLMVEGGTSHSDEIRVGDVSVRGGSATGVGQDAASIRDYFLGQVAHLLTPSCPALIATGGNRYE